MEDLAVPLPETSDYRERPVITACRTGRKSAKAAQILVQNGFTDVHVARTGMTAWFEQGYGIAHGFRLQRTREVISDMKILLLLNEAPYGSEKTYNALRLAMALQNDQPGTEVRVFLMADAVTAALPAQGTPQGYYNIERMVKSVINRGGQVKLCGACCEARGIKAMPLLNGVEISTMSQLAQWTAESEKVLVF